MLFKSIIPIQNSWQSGSNSRAARVRSASVYLYRLTLRRQVVPHKIPSTLCVAIIFRTVANSYLAFLYSLRNGFGLGGEMELGRA